MVKKFFQRMRAGEAQAKAELEALAQEHFLWEVIKPIRGFGPYLAGAFIAAGGDIERAPTCSAFWRGMGLDMVDGKAPRASQFSRVTGGRGEPGDMGNRKDGRINS